MTGEDAAVVAARLKALSSPERLEILTIIARTPGINAKTVREQLGRLTEPTVSYHLKALRRVGLVECGGQVGTSMPLNVVPGVIAGLAAQIGALG